MDAALKQIKVPGLMHTNNYDEKFKVLMSHATNVFNALLSRASKIPRNFIIDHSNLFKNARKRKLKAFADFKKIAVLWFFQAQKNSNYRSDKRYKVMRKKVPTDVIGEYTLPMADEYFDQVWFVELDGEESQRVTFASRDMQKKLIQDKQLFIAA